MIYKIENFIIKKIAALSELISLLLKHNLQEFNSRIKKCLQIDI